jgi:hypothetical protein
MRSRLRVEYEYERSGRIRPSLTADGFLSRAESWSKPRDFLIAFLEEKYIR